MKSKRFSEKIKETVFSKQFAICMVLLFACTMPMFAASSGDSIVELDNWASKILELFQSSWVKALLLIALIVEAIALVLAGQQGGGGQVLRRFLPWIAGTIILLSASSICSYFLEGMSFQVSMAPPVLPSEMIENLNFLKAV